MERLMGFHDSHCTHNLNVSMVSFQFVVQVSISVNLVCIVTFFFSRLLALRNIYSGRLLPLNIYSGRHWVRNALGMMDCHIHYAIVTVRCCTDIFSRFFALRNTHAGHVMDSIGTTQLGSVSFVDAIKLWLLFALGNAIDVHTVTNDRSRASRSVNCVFKKML